MVHLARTLSAFLHEHRLLEPGPFVEGLGDEPKPLDSVGTGYFIGAMLLIFAVAVLLALAIRSQ